MKITIELNGDLENASDDVLKEIADQVLDNLRARGEGEYTLGGYNDEGELSADSPLKGRMEVHSEETVAVLRDFIRAQFQKGLSRVRVVRAMRTQFGYGLKEALPLVVRYQP